MSEIEQQTEVTQDVGPDKLEEIAEKHAIAYEQLRMQIRGIIPNLSLKGLQRVLIMVTEFPFAENPREPKSKLELDLMTALISINNIKASLMNYINKEEVTKQVVSNVADELTKEGEENGKVE
jgi:hypothetical protein